MRFSFILMVIGVAVLATLPSVARAGNDPEPMIKISPPKLEFGSVESTRMKSVKVKNQGKVDLTVSAISLCSGTSTEFSWVSGMPATLAPKETQILDVSYTPVDAGPDSGCVEIASNDPKRPSVEVSLRGKKEDDTVSVDGPDIDLQPRVLDFGNVPVGGSATRAVKVKNKGTTSLDGVIFGRSFPTSDEYTWAPATLFSVPPDENVVVDVTYSPIDEGVDEGSLEVVSNDPDENPAVLRVSGTGGDAGAGLVDLDITKFKVKKEFEDGSIEEVFVHLWVRNEGGINEPRQAVVIGMQGTVVVYDESLMVSDKPGNRGSRMYSFPSYLPVGAGEILWMATVEDNDPDVDEAFAVTQVPGAVAPSVGLDLDIAKLKPTKKVSLRKGKPIRLRVWVENPGALDEVRSATLSGVQGGIEVYLETLEVADIPGDDEATRYNFPRYMAEAPGDILWKLVIADEDPDVDQMSAVTKVKP